MDSTFIIFEQMDSFLTGCAFILAFATFVAIKA